MGLCRNWQWQNSSACQPKIVVRGLNFGSLWQRPPQLGVWSAADTALFAATWRQKHIRVKLNSGLLTNEKKETDTEFHQIILRLAS